MADKIEPQTTITTQINQAVNSIGTTLSTAVLGKTADVDNLYSDSPNESPFFKSGNMHFPSDLENYTYYMTFGFKTYERKSVLSPPTFANIGKIRLPIAANIVDNIKVNFEETAPPFAVGAGLEIGSQFGKGGGVVGAAGGLAVNSLGSVVSSAVSKFSPSTAAAAGAAIENAPFILQPLGLAVNPFLQVLFKSPTFKRHAFSWRFSPDTQKESETLNKILMSFKYHMLPDLQSGTAGALLKYPDLCDVTIQPEDKWLYKFKPCVVESVSINYAPNQQPAFFGSTRAPAEIQFTVNLLEIEYWLKKDMLAAGQMTGAI